ncbi:alpha-L-fucosidase [Naematelia encephala]|uniref:Alpha-L-fucosidase n=1 Tax=Naematelia encephala TaxID=71784 RepID=A0A1Y2AWZ9_9TREE|nr:alpha-L-fucosidase [Naematelia encephala]
MSFCSGVSSVDWRAFLAQHDLVWTQLPEAWDEGPFMGNGMLGSMLYYDTVARSLRLDINSTEVQDHRRPIVNSGIENSRLPVGHFLLRTAGSVIDASFRLDLYDATCLGTLRTTEGAITLKIYVHSLEMVTIVFMSSTLGEADAAWEFVPEEAFSVRQAYGLRTNVAARFEKDYEPNPKGFRRDDGFEQLWVQPLHAGGGTASAWNATDGRLIVSIAYDRMAVPETQVLNTVRRLKAADESDMSTSHLAWWHAYYQASFVTIPDARLESFYWIQMYKIACATREDRAMVDNNGPWLQETPWSYATWNLNVQLTYWCMIPSNRAALVRSLMNTIHDHREELIKNCEPRYRHDSATLLRTTGTDLHAPANAPSETGTVGCQSGLSSGSSDSLAPPEVGNLPWALHNCWLAFKHTMDLEMLREKLYPMLRRTTNYYLHFLTRSEDGKLHLLPTYSPEYGSARDTVYNLAILRWSCTALLEAADLLGIDDNLIPSWKNVLQDLVDYPADDAMGWLIGDDLPLSTSHRHYSHILQAYPLYLVNRDQGKPATEIIRKTLEHWQSMPEMLRGYSCTGAASISAALGKGDDALAYLMGLFDDFIRPNTMYKEDGPVIETPLSGAQSILDMLCQSWGGVVRPFPAMPALWKQALFADLTAEGGFVLSARWEGSKTKWISIHSKAGQPLIVETDISQPKVIVDGMSLSVVRNDSGFLVIDLKKGETVLIHPKDDAPNVAIVPIRQASIYTNIWGINPHSINSGNRESRIDG